MYKLFYFFKRVRMWLKKSFEYSCYLWVSNDNDFDWYHILRVLKYKLERTRKHIVKHDFIADVTKISRQIRFAEIVIERIINDDYCSELYDAHNNKWGELKLVCVEDDKTKRSYITMKRENINTENEKSQQWAEMLKIVNEHERQATKDLNRLFRHMRKYIRSWWD